MFYVPDHSLQSSYPAFVFYTSLIYNNMTTPVYTTLKGVGVADTKITMDTQSHGFLREKILEFQQFKLFKRY